MKGFLILLFLSTIIGVFGQTSDKYNSEYATFYRAEDLYTKEQFSAARYEFRSFVNQYNKPNDPLYIKALYYEGLSALELFQNDAVDLLITFNKNYPESIYHNTIFFRLGKYYYQKKDYKEALNWYNQLTAVEVDDENKAEYYFKKGYCLFQLERFTEARNNFFEIKDGETQYANPALYYYSHISYQEKAYQTALDGFLKLEHVEQYQKVAPYYITQILYLQRKYKEVTDYAPHVLDTTNVININDINHIVGDSYFKLKKYDEAVNYLQKYNAESNTTREDDYELGFSYFKIDALDKAISMFNKVTETRDSLSQIAYYHIGEAYQKMNKLSPARSAFNEASIIGIDPKIAEDALYNYAILSYKLDINPYDEAVDALQLYLKKYPNSTRKNDIYQYLVNVYTTTNKFSKALQSLEKLQHKDIRLKSAYQLVAYNCGVELYQNGKYQDAINHFELVDKYPIDPKISANAKFWSADSKFMMQKYQGAIVDYRAYLNSSGIENSTLKADAYYNIGYAYYAKSDTSMGVENFRLYTQMVTPEKTLNKKKLADAYMRAGDGYYILKDNENAIKFYQGALTLKAGYEDQALYYLAKTYSVTTGRNDDKIAVLQELINNHSSSKYILTAIYDIAQTYKFMAKNDQALKYFQQIVTDYPNTVLVKTAKVQIADIYFKKYDFAKSERMYKETLEEYSSDKEICETAANGLISIYKELKKVDLAIKVSEDYPCAGMTKDQQERDLFYLPAMKTYNDTTKTAEAIVEIEKYLERYQNGIYTNEMKYHLADCYYRQKNFDKAISMYTQLLNEPTNGFTETAALRVSKFFYNNQKYQDVIPYYEKLETITSNPTILFNSRLGLMRSYFNVSNWLKASDYSKLVLQNTDLNNTLKMEAEYAKGMSNYYLNNFDLAKPSLEWIVKNTTTEKGAEAKFTLAEMYFQQKDYEKSDAEVRALLKMKPTYNYWVAKALILQSRTLIIKQDLFQAEQTLKSVREHYTVMDDGIMEEANEVWNELMQLKNQPKSIKEEGTNEIEIKEGN